MLEKRATADTVDVMLREHLSPAVATAVPSDLVERVRQALVTPRPRRGWMQWARPVLTRTCGVS